MERPDPTIVTVPRACPHDRPGSLCADCKVRSVSVCAALDESELAGLAALATGADYSAKAELFPQGAAARHVFNVTEGTVRTYRVLPDGRRQILGFLLPGDFIGLALTPTYAFGAEAVSAVKACRFERPAFEALVAAKPHLLRRLHEAASHELSLAQDHMVLLGRRTAEEKLAAFLLGLRDRLVRLGGSRVTLPLAMTRQDIADHLGLTIETVSRTFTKFVRDRVLLIVPDGVRLLDAARLETMLAA